MSQGVSERVCDCACVCVHHSLYKCVYMHECLYTKCGSESVCVINPASVRHTQICLEATQDNNGMSQSYIASVQKVQLSLNLYSVFSASGMLYCAL